MKLAPLFLAASLITGVALAQSSAPVERLYVALNIDSVLSELDAGTEPMLIEELERSAVEQRGSPLSKAERAQLVIAVRNALAKRGPLDRAAAKSVYQKALTSQLSEAEMEAAIAFYSTPTGKRIHFAVIEAEKAVTTHLEEVNAKLPPIQIAFPSAAGSTK
jgi:hypothetical protein